MLLQSRSFLKLRDEGKSVVFGRPGQFTILCHFSASHWITSLPSAGMRGEFVYAVSPQFQFRLTPRVSSGYFSRSQIHSFISHQILASHRHASLVDVPTHLRYDAQCAGETTLVKAIPQYIHTWRRRKARGRLRSSPKPFSKSTPLPMRVSAPRPTRA